MQIKKNTLQNAIRKFVVSDKNPVDFQDMFIQYHICTRPDAGLTWPEIRDAIVRAIHDISSEKSIWIIFNTDSGYYCQHNEKVIFDDIEKWDSRERLLDYLVSRGIDIKRIFYYE